MNRHGHMGCQPGRPHKKNTFCRKIGIIMLLSGAVTVMALFLPLKCLVVLLCFVLIICGILLIKK
ncbi:MAG: hypothetical protein SOV50_03605 [Lentihominibacter sp.]|nr:hypothetical protein [Clostridiales bacterium]MDY2679725.1 hypothetical protein [Lentihominibacter sp.]